MAKKKRKEFKKKTITTLPPDRILAKQIGLKIHLPENNIPKLSIPDDAGNVIRLKASMPWLVEKYLNSANIPCGWYEWDERYIYIFENDFLKSVKFLFEKVGFKPKGYGENILIDIP